MCGDQKDGYKMETTQKKGEKDVLDKDGTIK